MPCVATIIVNLVPYHHARWEAFTRASATDCQLVELTDRDAFRVLEFSAASNYQRHTLFPSASREKITTRLLRKTMTEKLDAIRPQVVCVSGWSLPVSLAGLAWATRRRVPIVIVSESNEFDQTRSSVKEFIKKRVIALCSAGLAGGTPQADYLAKLGLRRDCIFLGYDVVDNRYFQDKVAENGRRKETINIQFAPPAKYYLACARFGEKKNLIRLIEAYSQYRQLCFLRSGTRGTITCSPLQFPRGENEVRPWDLVIAGDGEKRGDIEAAIRRFGVEESTRLLGAKSYSDMPNLYGSASAFVHASTTEQWGLVVNEAMASGLPVLVSNRCGCAVDLVKEGVNGFTFDPYNVGEIAQLLLRLWGMEKESIIKMGEASRKIISDWGPERFAQGFKGAMEKALQSQRKPAGILDLILLRVLTVF